MMSRPSPTHPNDDTAGDATVGVTVDQDGLARLATDLAGTAKPGDLIALFGDLGAGKTTFARAFITARAQQQNGTVDEVPSPTFTLAQTYELPGGDIWHFDLYRIEAPGEIWELGIEEALAGGICLIEWPERMGALLPPRRIDIAIDFTDAPDRRRVTVRHHHD